MIVNNFCTSSDKKKLSYEVILHLHRIHTYDDFFHNSHRNFVLIAYVIHKIHIQGLPRKVSEEPIGNQFRKMTSDGFGTRTYWLKYFHRYATFG